jgi:hypothetical protein
MKEVVVRTEVLGSETRWKIPWKSVPTNHVLIVIARVSYDVLITSILMTRVDCILF